jgi:hypothetical protein
MRASVFALALGCAGLGRAFASATGCDDLDAQPVQYTISYSAIQTVFNTNCVACHASYVDCDPANGPGNPPAGLDLCPGVSWSAIVNHASSQNAAYTRVLPNQPQTSLLFHKVNCAAPDVGSRMPYGGPYLSAYEQALLRDWIAGGAPIGTTEGIFRDSFD